MNEIILLGSGGHASSVLDTFRRLRNFNVIGILDKEEQIGKVIDGIPIIGTDQEMAKYYNQGIEYIFIGVGSIGNTEIRRKLYEKALKIGFKFPNIIDPTAIIGDQVVIEEGVYIGKGVIVNVGSHIGRQCILNTGAIVEHDCKIGEFVHIAPGATLSGGVQIGSHTHIGVNSTVIQGIHIGEHTLIGAGSVVVKDIASYKKAYGNPCEVVGESE